VVKLEDSCLYVEQQKVIGVLVDDEFIWNDITDLNQE